MQSAECWEGRETNSMRRFEDINAWGKARQLVKEIYEAGAQGAFGKDFALRDQTRRAAVPIMSTITQGFARRTHKEFQNFLTMAHGSAAEVQSQLYVALDLGYLPEERFQSLYSKVEEVSRMVQVLHTSLSTTPEAGKDGGRSGRTHA